jgi:putative copper export protein
VIDERLGQHRSALFVVRGFDAVVWRRAVRVVQPQRAGTDFGAVLPFRPLLAGSAIVGALLSVVGMLLMVSAMSGESNLGELRPHMEMMVLETDAGMARSVTGFESVGALIVAVIIVTGVVNYLFIVGTNVGDVLLSTYGILLFLKVALFAGMLVLAALNRFHLGPLLQQSLREGQYRMAANALRRSVRVELFAALLIVGLVAWLGTLSPQVGEQ